MSLVLSPDAERDLRRYLYRVWADDPQASIREALRLQLALEDHASSALDGRVVAITRWPRALRRQFIHPFVVYYERRSDVLYVVCMHHHARRPIER